MIMNLNQKAMIARAGNEAKMMGNDYIGSEHVWAACCLSILPLWPWSC